MNDLVLGTFGRGFYVLDDYSLLEVLKQASSEKAMILPIRDAIMWEKSNPLGYQVNHFKVIIFIGENLDPVAMINYYYSESFKSLKEKGR